MACKMDNLTKEMRSNIMRGIKGKNTKPEKIVRSLLHELKLRFRLHRKDLPGKPDICLPKYKTVILVHGCFWHHHTKCKEGRMPSSNIEFWTKKIRRNIERDAENQAALRKLGWTVETIWECQVKNERLMRKRLLKLFSKDTRS